MTNWEQLVTILSYVKPRCIDREGIKAQLEIDKTFDLGALDHLYMMRIIEHDEYIKYLQKLVDNKKEDISFIEYIIEKAKEDERYSPLYHYTCTGYPCFHLPQNETKEE